LIYVSIFIVLVLILGVFNYTSYILSDENDLNKGLNHLHNHSYLNTLVSSPTKISWEDLINDCGAKVMVENSARASEIFNRKFVKKNIEWKGYFLSAFIQAFNPLDFNPEHILNLNIRMIPSESLNNPDLFLSLDSAKYNKYLNEIRKLKTGDPVIFKASFEALGNEWRPHHLHLIEIKKIDDFIDPDKKVLLFQGINFDISGHLKNEKEINEIQKESDMIKQSNSKENNNINSTDHENKNKAKIENITKEGENIEGVKNRINETNETVNNINKEKEKSN